jgi:teichuronic acid exporter
VFDLLSFVLILHSGWASSEDLGTATLVVTLFGALQLVVDAGLPSALVQRDDSSDERRSTMYWTSMMAGAALYGVIWLVSPLFASFYHLPVLVPIFRIAGLLLVIRPLYTTHTALLRREFRFREFSVVRTIANTVEFATKLGVAIAIGGPWPFVLAPVLRELTYAIGIPLCERWRPRRVWRLALVRDDFRFGIRSTGGELLFQVYSNLDYQVVGYAFGTAALGVYRAAYELVLEPVRIVSNVITVVALATFAKLRD